MVHPKLVIEANVFICFWLKPILYLALIFCNISFLASAFEIFIKTLPSLSIVTSKMFSGMILSLILDGTSTSTGSFDRKLAASIKNVTSKNAKTTIGVISMDGECFGTFILGIFICFNEI